MPRKATKPITVYKIVIRRSKKHKERFHTPLLGQYVHLNEHMSASCSPQEKLLQANKNIVFYTKKHGLSHRPRPDALKLYEIGAGYIHCCTTIEYAQKWIIQNANLFLISMFHSAKCWAIIECVIEPGTLYYKSFDDTQICAKSIRTKGIVLKG